MKLLLFSNILPLEYILQIYPIDLQDLKNVSLAALKLLGRSRYATMFSKALTNIFEWDI